MSVKKERVVEILSNNIISVVHIEVTELVIVVSKWIKRRTIR